MNRIEINVITGEQTIIPLTEEEIAQSKINTAIEAELRAKEETIKNSALAKLIALGLTQDEIKALIE